MAELFHSLIYEPILRGLVFIYENLAFHNLGTAIILLTLAIRVILFPLFYMQAKSQAIFQKIQPQIKKIQEQHKNDKAKQAEELMKLYKEHKTNPLTSIVLLLVQLPIIIGLYQVLSREVSAQVFENTLFLGADMTKKNLLMAAIAAALQYFQTRMSIPKTKGETVQDPTRNAMRTMMYIGPALTMIVLFNLPSAIGLYWGASTLFSMGQQILINRRLSKEEGARAKEQ